MDLLESTSLNAKQAERNREAARRQTEEGELRPYITVSACSCAARGEERERTREKDKMEAIKEMLVSLGIAAGPAEGYATLLCEDGFDTRTAFDALSLTELKEDFGFKRGHLRMVEQARDAAPGEVSRDEADPFATSTSAGARLGGGSAEGEGSEERDRLPLALPPEISPQRTIFGSMRFPVSAEARALAEALELEGIHLKIVDLRPGADIRHESVFLLSVLPVSFCVRAYV